MKYKMSVDFRPNILLLALVTLLFLMPVVSYLPLLAYSVPDAQATYTYVQYGGCFDAFGNYRC